MSPELHVKVANFCRAAYQAGGRMHGMLWVMRKAFVISSQMYDLTAECTHRNEQPCFRISVWTNMNYLFKSFCQILPFKGASKEC